MNHEPHCPVTRAEARGEGAVCLCREGLTLRVGCQCFIEHVNIDHERFKLLDDNHMIYKIAVARKDDKVEIEPLAGNKNKIIPWGTIVKIVLDTRVTPVTKRSPIEEWAAVQEFKDRHPLKDY